MEYPRNSITMDASACSLENECSALGGLFVQIINEMKGSTAVWEDFTAKATKLHTALRATILATTAFLDSFQKIADVATNTRGATRELGSSLTRICLRHRNIENKLKTYTRSIMETLVQPLQEKVEEWKRNVTQLDKDHLKEYKRARQEIKRASAETLKLQKKAKKGKGDVQTRLENSLQDVSDKYILWEDTEKNAVRNALIEQRSHFCIYVSCLKPVLDHELAIVSEMTLVQEILHNLCMQADDPYNLPPASEEVISDIIEKKGISGFSFNTPPSSPSSLGSRKSSMCSISSLASSSSGSAQAMSPSFQLRPRPISQPPGGTMRFSSISSQDSGFTSQDTLFHSMATNTMDNMKSQGEYLTSMTEDTTDKFRWPNPTMRHLSGNRDGDKRPHTISAAYEKSHGTRPSLSADIFAGREHISSVTAPSTPNPYAVPCLVPQHVLEHKPELCQQSGESPIYDSLKPPPGPKPRGKQIPSQMLPSRIGTPSYVNMNELAMLATKEHIEHYSTMVQKEDGISKQAAVQVPNSLELAQAIKELEESTAALKLTYDEDGNIRKPDDTDASTPTNSQTTVVPDVILYNSKKPETATIRRSSFSSNHRPNPPVRRSSSVLNAMPVRPPSIPSHSSVFSDEAIYSTPYGTAPGPIKECVQDVYYSPRNIADTETQGIYYSPRNIADTETQGIYYSPRNIANTETQDVYHSPRNIANTGVIEESNSQILQLAQQQLLQQLKHQIAPDHDTEKAIFNCDADPSLPPPPTEQEIVRSLSGSNIDIDQTHSNCVLQQPLEIHANTSGKDNFISDDNDVTPTGDAPEDNMLTLIRRGVRLRRTISNDRSAPVLRK